MASKSHDTPRVSAASDDTPSPNCLEGTTACAADRDQTTIDRCARKPFEFTSVEPHDQPKRLAILEITSALPPCRRQAGEPKEVRKRGYRLGRW